MRSAVVLAESLLTAPIECFFSFINRSMNHRFSMLVMLLLVVSGPGCGKKGPPHAPVVGTIRYQGRPVIGADVGFMPVERGAHSATAITDSQGNYQLVTPGLGPGALLGKHLVCVVLRDAPQPPSPKESQLSPLMQRRRFGKPLIPIKYFTPEKSGLSAEVADVSENRFDFDLTP